MFNVTRNIIYEDYYSNIRIYKEAYVIYINFNKRKQSAMYNRDVKLFILNTL